MTSLFYVTFKSWQAVKASLNRQTRRLEKFLRKGLKTKPIRYAKGFETRRRMGQREKLSEGKGKHKTVQGKSAARSMNEAIYRGLNSRLRFWSALSCQGLLFRIPRVAVNPVSEWSRLQSPVRRHQDPHPDPPQERVFTSCTLWLR